MKEDKKPPWIRARASWNENHEKVREILAATGLKTVCVEASCPNRGECWSARHVTFMILGDTCTRDCRFCDVRTGTPGIPDSQEPRKIAEAVKKLDLKYVVITSVTRDDLEDKGAGHFVQTVIEVSSAVPEAAIELLIPDFDARPDLLRKIAFSGAKVIGHNIEMPRALYAELRPRADYERSLDVLRILKRMKDEGAPIEVKSSIMLGLGETKNDILQTLYDLKTSGVDIVYIGQYLSPSKSHHPVKKYYTPEEFKTLKKTAHQIGFCKTLAAPMVRSSYRPI